MNRVHTVARLFAVFAAACSVAHAEILPQAGAGDPRIRTAFYSPDEVYRLYGRVGYDLALEFEPDEAFKSVNGGDLKAIAFRAEDNRFTFKPRVRTARSNLTVTTTKRHYYLDYSATDKEGDTAPDTTMFVVRFVYPAPPAKAPDPASVVAERLAHASAERPQNLDYAFCGRRELKPLAAFDDGVHTRLRFAPRAELPAVFLFNDDGTESLVNFTVENGDLVLHRVAHRWVLRRGHLTACIVNRAFTGGGERLDSGTVSPDVERASKGLQP